MVKHPASLKCVCFVRTHLASAHLAMRDVLMHTVNQWTGLCAGDKNMGSLTSVAQASDGSWFGLGYVRCKSRGQHQDLQGLEVQVDSAPAKVVSIPYATRSFAPAPDTANEPVAVAQATEPPEG